MQPHDDAPYAPVAPAAPSAAASGPRAVSLASAIDLDGFRRACRRLWAEQVEPERISWHTADEAESDLFDANAAAAVLAQAPAVQVPAAFMPLCESVVLHRDAGRFGLLYRLLWRLQREPGLRHEPHDADWALAQQLAQDVRRDMHEMKARLSFRVVDEGAGAAPLHLAWYEPEHHIVEATALFFARRFAAGTRWAIRTPQRSVLGDGERFVFGPGIRRDEIAPQLAQGSAVMAKRGPTEPIRRPARPQESSGDAATPPRVAPGSLATLAEALERCRECPLGEHATQAVPGEGRKHAALMFVGEQPGDQEDLQGRPFVGPAGQLFSRALAELGIERRDVFVSNAVKHFKFELRGKRRIHKTPAQEEAAACLHWLETEIELVDPGALVALGATAARQLLGTTIAVTRQRGQWLKRADGRRVLITLHPSALLRMEPEDKDAAYAAWLADLRQAAAAMRPPETPSG
jgi:uracil-DNA glycosylase